ncbi:hypothetical protein [Streptomyces sp. NPDC008001]|uniref:hypothetical protein n=1 Tax=Streptomyces sp. NPDC008001 TaxID=3364804 RepID=UPI0036E671B5
MTAALSYAVHTDPAPLKVSTDKAESRAVLRVTVTNPGPGPVACELITLTLPTGNGTGALTATPETITAHVEGGTGWQTEHAGGGVFQLRPADPGAELKPGESFVIRLDGIVVNRAAGTVTLGVADTTSGIADTTAGSPAAPPRTRTAGSWRLAKAPTGTMLEDFRPDRTSVPNGETVTLTWSCVDGPDYELFYGDQRVTVNDRIVDGHGSWTSPCLHTATAFMLLGSTEQDGAPVTYGLTTAVTVDVPDLEVGSLDANGTVRLFGEIQEIAGGVGSGTWTYRAATDGIITGYIKTNQTGTPATLNVFVTPPDTKQRKFAAQSWDAQGGMENREAGLLVPVSRGSVVSVVQKSDGGGFTAELTWFPFGSGPLQVVEP